MLGLDLHRNYCPEKSILLPPAETFTGNDSRRWAAFANVMLVEGTAYRQFREPLANAVARHCGVSFDRAENMLVLAINFSAAVLHLGRALIAPGELKDTHLSTARHHTEQMEKWGRDGCAGFRHALRHTTRLPIAEITAEAFPGRYTGNIGPEIAYAVFAMQHSSDRIEGNEGFQPLVDVWRSVISCLEGKLGSVDHRAFGLVFRRWITSRLTADEDEGTTPSKGSLFERFYDDLLAGNDLLKEIRSLLRTVAEIEEAGLLPLLAHELPKGGLAQIDLHVAAVAMIAHRPQVVHANTPTLKAIGKWVPIQRQRGILEFIATHPAAGKIAQAITQEHCPDAWAPFSRWVAEESSSVPLSPFTIHFDTMIGNALRRPSRKRLVVEAIRNYDPIKWYDLGVALEPLLTHGTTSHQAVPIVVSAARRWGSDYAADVALAIKLRIKGEPISEVGAFDAKEIDRVFPLDTKPRKRRENLPPGDGSPLEHDTNGTQSIARIVNPLLRRTTSWFTRHHPSHVEDFKRFAVEFGQLVATPLLLADAELCHRVVELYARGKHGVADRIRKALSTSLAEVEKLLPNLPVPTSSSGSTVPESDSRGGYRFRVPKGRFTAVVVVTEGQPLEAKVMQRLGDRFKRLDLTFQSATLHAVTKKHFAPGTLVVRIYSSSGHQFGFKVEKAANKLGAEFMNFWWDTEKPLTQLLTLLEHRLERRRDDGLESIHQ